MSVRFLVSDKTGDHLPYTDESGSTDHRLMGAAWAALHGGYRGNKYDGPSKDAAISKLKGLYKSEKMDTPQESAGNLCGFVCNIMEAVADSGVFPIRIIQPGFNKSGQRYYPADMLKADGHVFEGAKMFENHQTDNESRQRPEGRTQDWVAMLRNVKVGEGGALFGEAVVVDPGFKNKLELLQKNGLLGEMGVSIRAEGVASKKVVDGKATNYIESLTRARSVDFVTYAGAGGRIEAMESDSDSFDYQITVKKENINMLTEAEITKLQTDLAAANAKVTAVEAENTVLKGASQKLAVQAELEKHLKEAGKDLPEVAVNRLKKQFENTTVVAGIKEAVEAEAAYVKSLGGKKVTKMGEKDAGEGDGKKPEEIQKSLKESFISMGLSEKEAELASKQ